MIYLILYCATSVLKCFASLAPELEIILRIECMHHDSENNVMSSSSLKKTRSECNPRISTRSVSWIMRGTGVGLIALLLLSLLFLMPKGHASAASPVLAVSPTGFIANSGCSYSTGNGWMCTAILSRADNLSTSMHWSSTSNLPGSVIFSPSSGVLAANGSVSVTISISSTNVTCPTKIVFSFKGSANTVGVPWLCTAPAVTLSPTSFTSTSCIASAPGWTCSETLSESVSSEGNVAWSAKSNLSGTTFTPSSGTLTPGGSGQISIFIPVASCKNGDFYFSIQGGNTFTTTWKCSLSYSISDGGSPSSIATGDFNGDGKLDIVTANTAFSEIAVLLNKGNNHFSKPTYYAAGSGVGTGPQSIVVADFNGDGHPDIAVANFNAASVSVFLNNGDGTFASGVTYSVGSYPLGLAVGDFNGDGHLDLVVASEGGAGGVSVLLNNGNGTFANAVTYNAGLTGAPVAVAVGDVNGDGHPDIVTSTSNSVSVGVLLNNGDGTFGAATNYSVGSGASSMALMDVNGDGHLDIVTANFNDNTISVLLNTGTGTFGAATTYSVGNGPNDVVLGDFNGDGHVDIATANYYSSNVSVLLNTNTGTFGTASTHSINGFGLSIAIGDFNGDGKLDIVTANQGDTLTVLLNNGFGAF